MVNEHKVLPLHNKKKKYVLKSKPVSLANHKQLWSPINAECVLRHTGYRKQSFDDNVTLHFSCAPQ